MEQIVDIVENFCCTIDLVQIDFLDQLEFLIVMTTV